MKPIILVSGASSTVGAACTRHLSRSGYEVFTVAREGTASSPWVRDCLRNEEVTLDEDRIAEFVVEQIWNQRGAIHAVVNCLDYGLIGPIEETTLEETQSLFEANVFDMVRLCRAVLPLMRARRSGLIINVGLAPGAVPPVLQGVYSASRLAMEGLSNTLGAEVEQFGVQVMLIRMNHPATGPEVPVARRARRKYGAYKELLKQHRSLTAENQPDESPRSTALLIEGLIRDSAAGTRTDLHERHTPRLFTQPHAHETVTGLRSTHVHALATDSPSFPLITFAGTWTRQGRREVEQAVLSFELLRLQRGGAGPKRWTCVRRPLQNDSTCVAHRSGEAACFTARTTRELAHLISEKHGSSHSSAPLGRERF